MDLGHGPVERVTHLVFSERVIGKHLGLLGTVSGKNVFLHPSRRSKLEGPPFEGPETSVQGPQGVGAPHPTDIKRMGE